MGKCCNPLIFHSSRGAEAPDSFRGWNPGLPPASILDEHEMPTPARVYLLDAAGKPQFAPGTIVYDKTNRNGFSERHFVPPTGTFHIDLPAGKYRLIVERGKEIEPFDQEIDVPDDRLVTRSVKSVRWIDMAARHWYSGDMHVHRPLSQLAVLMQAEDLDVAVPLTRLAAFAECCRRSGLAAHLSPNRMKPACFASARIGSFPC